jgi:hypothetical protein
MPYEERCCLLKWPTLEKRREYLSLVECIKSIHGLNGLVFKFVLNIHKTTELEQTISTSCTLKLKK